MIYTLINKNLLIPLIEERDNLDMLLQKMLDITYDMDKLYCSNVYIVGTDGIYFSNNNKIYLSNGTTNIQIQKNISSKAILNNIKLFIFENINDTLSSKYDNNMDININIKKQNKIIIKEIDEIKNKEELELITLIEETMKIYQDEVLKMKDLEKQIKILDDSQKSLIKKVNEQLFTNFSKLKNDYNTFKLIKKKQLQKPEMDIPSLFEFKYNYFTNLLTIDNNKTLLEQIEEMNLDEILNLNNDLDNDIKLLSNKYGDESKKLNVKFDHSWEDLEVETEPTEVNNSRFGGL